MPPVDAVLLPLCVGLTLLGLIIIGVAWGRGRRGRAVQGLALALAPIALYLSGLLRLVWDGAVAVVAWAGRLILSPTVWLGLGLLAVCLVLWVVGGFVARRSPTRAQRRAARAEAAAGSASPAALPATRRPPAGARQAPPVDDDMAEIEALLKARGIE